MSRTESAFWTVLFLALGTVLILARTAADGAWPVFVAAISYACAAFFAFQLLIASDRNR